MNPDSILKSIGSEDPEVSLKAQKDFAAYMGPIVEKVLSNKPMMFDDKFSSLGKPSFPLDLSYRIKDPIETMGRNRLAKRLVKQWRKTL